jgi:hypothetical protein
MAMLALMFALVARNALDVQLAAADAIARPWMNWSGQDSAPTLHLFAH